MEKKFVFEGFNLWNTNEFKVPISNGYPNFSWSPFNDFHNYKLDKKKPLAFRCGLQQNGKYIIRIDADIWKYDKTNKKEIKEQSIEDLFNDILDFNKEHLGVYATTTCGNHALLLDISNDKNLISILESYNLSVIGKGLEILICKNAILPSPKSVCICKRHNKCCRSALFCNEYASICKINSGISKFLIKYISQFENKSLTKHKLRDNTIYKTGNDYYTSISQNSYINLENIPYLENVFKMIDDIIPEYMIDYIGILQVVLNLLMVE
jgi:hypothetical protein